MSSIKTLRTPSTTLLPEQVWVTADQMRQIESRSFVGGLPVAALMEKAGQRLARRIQQLCPDGPLGVLVGPGHNGGDALVVARELSLRGRAVRLYSPLTSFKPLTQQHWQYATHLDLPGVEKIEQLSNCAAVIDGLFGFGLTRPIAGALATDLHWLNASDLKVISIDLPSGIETDSGEPLGVAVRSHPTQCLGLWKQAFAQTAALPYLGHCERIDLDLPPTDIQAVLGAVPNCRRLTRKTVLAALPLQRVPTVHKYSVGQLLLVAGSRTYAGAALLAARGARASGVGMVTLAVPESLQLMAVDQAPEALVVGCPEHNGVIQALPESLVPTAYDVISMGPGLTPQAEAVVSQLLTVPVPLVIDADALNILAATATVEALRQRPAATVLTPHPGEFRRLFPDLPETLAVAQAAANLTGTTVVLKRARSTIATPHGPLWINPDSTAALARGGSGDVLTGLLGGLWASHRAQQPDSADVDTSLQAALGAVGWHAATAQSVAQRRTVFGVDPVTLATALPDCLNTLREEMGSMPAATD